MFKHILVPVDGSDISRHIYEDAVALSDHFNSEKITLLYVFEEMVAASPDHGTFVNVNIVNQMKQEAQVKLQQIVEEVPSNVPTKIEVTSGDPRRIIAEDFPDANGVDLIVMGATGKNNLERMLIGSVAQYVAKNAKVDTFLVR